MQLRAPVRCTSELCTEHARYLDDCLAKHSFTLADTCFTWVGTAESDAPTSWLASISELSRHDKCQGPTARSCCWLALPDHACLSVAAVCGGLGTWRKGRGKGETSCSRVHLLYSSHTDSLSLQAAAGAGSGLKPAPEVQEPVLTELWLH